LGAEVLAIGVLSSRLSGHGDGMSLPAGRHK
jgi:hypothetical protein